jgi:hypothetical protein
LRTSVASRRATRITARRAAEAAGATLRRAEVAQHLLLFGRENLFQLGVDDFLESFHLAALLVGQAETLLHREWNNLARTRALSAEAAAAKSAAAAQSASIAASSFAHWSASAWLTAEAVARLAAVRPVPLRSATSISIARRSITVAGRAAGPRGSALGSAPHRATAPARLGQGGALFGEEFFEFGLGGGPVLIHIGAIEQRVKPLVREFRLRQRAILVGVEGEEPFNQGIHAGGRPLFWPASAVAGGIGLSEGGSGDEQQCERVYESRHV